MLQRVKSIEVQVARGGRKRGKGSQAAPFLFQLPQEGILLFEFFPPSLTDWKDRTAKSASSRDFVLQLSGEKGLLWGVQKRKKPEVGGQEGLQPPMWGGGKRSRYSPQPAFACSFLSLLCHFQGF